MLATANLNRYMSCMMVRVFHNRRSAVCLLQSAVSGDPSAFQKQHPVAKCAGFLAIVGDEKHGDGVFSEPALQIREDAMLQFVIERRKRFIQEEQSWLRYQSAPTYYQFHLRIAIVVSLVLVPGFSLVASLTLIS